MRQRRNTSGIGLGVDVTGGPVIDPTENVLALVDVEKSHANELRLLETRYQNDMREAAFSALKDSLDAETRRIDQLAAMRDYYNTIIKEMEANSLKLLAEQLKENKTDSGTRTSLLEQFRWESGGKSTGISFSGAVIVQILISCAALATVIGFVITRAH